MLRLRGDRWVAVEFVPRDLWVGAYWEWKPADYATARGCVVEEFHLWFCWMPCLPLHYVAASRYAPLCPCGRGVARRYGRGDDCGEVVPGARRDCL